MAEYLAAAQVKEHLRLNPSLINLNYNFRNPQDDNVLIVRDLKSLAGLSESLLNEARNTMKRSQMFEKLMIKL